MPAPKKRTGLWIAIAVIVLVAAIVGGLYLAGFFRPATVATTPQAIFLPSYPEQGDKLIPTWWQNRQTWNAQWLWSEGVESNAFFGRLRTAGVDTSIFEGTAPTPPQSPDYNTSSGIFNSDYQTRFGSLAPLFAPHSYDAVFIIAMAFQKAQTLDTNSSAFKQALRDVANPPGTAIRPGMWTEAKAALIANQDIDYQGASGAVNFDSLGEVGSDYKVYGINAAGQSFQKRFIPEGSWIGASPPSFVSALSVGTPEPQQGTPLKIGTLFDITGVLKDFGPGMQNGTDLAAEQINAEGGITIATTLYDVLLVHEDDGTDTTKTTNAATKLVNVDQVRAVVGATASSMSIAAFGITRPAGIIQMSASSTSAALSPPSFDPGDQFWRTSPSDQLQGSAAAWYAYAQRGWRTMSITYVDNAYGRGLASVFETEFEARGGRILRSIPHPENAALLDANSVLTTLFTPVTATPSLLATDARRKEGL